MAENSSQRRDFLGGLAAGGVIGAIGGWFAHSRWNAPRPAAPADATSPVWTGPQLDHANFMRRAIAQGQMNPRYPFGAVLVRIETAEITAEGHNRSSVNPTFHGEMDVINRQAELQPQTDWESLALYTTAEPCPMCQSAIEWAGIPLVIYGSSVPFLKELNWDQIDIRAEEVARRTLFRRTVILGGILEPECDALFRRAVTLGT